MRMYMEETDEEDVVYMEEEDDEDVYGRGG